MKRLQLARIRQEVRILKGRRSALERVAMSFVPMVAASFLERQFRPGGAPAYYLSIHTPDNSAHRYVRKEKVDYFRRRTAHWREYVRAMAEWVRINQEIERRLRELGKGRCEKLEVRRGGKSYRHKPA